MKLVKFSQQRNDLFAEIGTCNCPTFPESLELSFCKKRITLTGYNDQYFFEKVNAEPRSYKCHQCGKEFWYQWTPEGVRVVELPEQEKEKEKEQ